MNFIRTAMLLALLTALFMAIGYLIGGTGGMMIAFVIAAAMNLFSYWNGDRMVLRMHQAVEVGPENAPEYHEIVRRLAEAADLPMPRTYVINSAQPNAFATGRGPRHAAVAVSTGLLETLTTEEVAGVMAHELAHISNRDTLTMTITATLAGAISMLGNFAFFSGGGRNSRNALATLLAIVVAPLAAMLVQMAISRTREYSADRLGAQICGRPLWLASALEKIAAASRRIPNLLAEANPASAHMFIVNPLGQHARDSLFSTHPNPANRIEALRQMDRDFAPAPEEPLQETGNRADAGSRNDSTSVNPPPAPRRWGRGGESQPRGKSREGPWN